MKKFTPEEVKQGIEHCIKEDCYGCPFSDIPLIECEIKVLDLSLQLIKTYEGMLSQINKADTDPSKGIKQKRRKWR